MSGRATGLWLSDEVLEWLTVWSVRVRCKWLAYGPPDATAIPSSLASLKWGMFYFSGAGLPRLSWKELCWRICVWLVLQTNYLFCVVCTCCLILLCINVIYRPTNNKSVCCWAPVPAALSRYPLPTGHSAAHPPAAAVSQRNRRIDRRRPLHRLGCAYSVGSISKVPWVCIFIFRLPHYVVSVMTCV